MIDYDPGCWGIGFIFQWKGSVYPKTLFWTVPGTLLAILLHQYFRKIGYNTAYDDSGIKLGLSCYNIALSFVLVFRTQQAYARWWEGGGLLQTMRGEWLNAFSSITSFTSRDPQRHEEVDQFEHQLVRFISLLHGAAMRQISTSRVANFEIFHLHGVDKKLLKFLEESGNGCEVYVVLQWIQRLIVDAMNNGVLPIPPPILSRSFQELSRGTVNLANAHKISELPFPFPYAQMINTTLVFHTMLMPVLLSILCVDTWWVGIISAATITSFWSINYVAQEIECPFGDDTNDLPLQGMQKQFNRVLAALMMREAQRAPSFNFQKDIHRIFYTNSITPSSDMDLGSNELQHNAALPRQGTFLSTRITRDSIGSGYSFADNQHSIRQSQTSRSSITSQIHLPSNLRTERRRPSSYMVQTLEALKLPHSDPFSQGSDSLEECMIGSEHFPKNETSQCIDTGMGTAVDHNPQLLNPEDQPVINI